jgi:hypothetical protein
MKLQTQTQRELMVAMPAILVSIVTYIIDMKMDLTHHQFSYAFAVALISTGLYHFFVYQEHDNG